MALNLDFVSSGDNQQPSSDLNNINNAGGLNLSFVSTADTPMTAAQQAAQIMTDQDAGKFPQGSRVDRSFFTKLPDVISGRDRQTTATQRLPELGTELGIGDFLGDKANLASGATLAVTPNPVETVQMLDDALGGNLAVQSDEAGNIIVHNPANGATALVNRPGFSKLDSAQLGGLMAAYSPAGRAALGAKTLLGGATKVGAGSAATQTAIEGTQAAQGGSFDPTDIALSGTVGAAAQGLTQVLAQRLPFFREQIRNSGITEKIRNEFKQAAVEIGLNADDITDDLIIAATRDAQQAVKPNQALAIAGESEFDIPITSGQRSLDDAALSAEDRLRSGVRGEQPQRIIRDFERDVQQPAIDRAAQQVKTQLGDVEGSPGGIVREGIKTAERQADDAVSEAYEQVGRAELSVEGIKGLFRQVKNAVRGVEYDKTLPQTKAILDSASKFQKTIKTLEGKGLRPMDLRRIEQLRKRINTAINAADNPADKAQVTQIKRAFDDYLDTAIQKALFSGDEGSIEALKNARGLFSDYAKKFRAQPKRGKSGRVVDRDEPGQFIEKIIDANPTNEQIVNAVFGASNLNKGGGALMARRFKEILGADSEGFAAIRTAAVKRLIKTTKVNGKDIISGQQTLKAIDDAVEKNNSLLKELFSPQEISLLKRFAAQVKRTQPDLVKSRENPSGTAQVLTKTLSNLAGFGDLSLFVTAKGIEASRGFRSSTVARNAVRPFDKQKRARTTIVTGSTVAPQFAPQLAPQLAPKTDN